MANTKTVHPFLSPPPHVVQFAALNVIVLAFNINKRTRKNHTAFENADKFYKIQKKKLSRFVYLC